MNKPGRNDPCPCGSGKKYKQCCLNKPHPNTIADGQDTGVPTAIEWLLGNHGKAVEEALAVGFFGSLDDEEYALLRDTQDEAFEVIMANAMEWLLAEGNILLKGRQRPVAEVLLGQGGPLSTAEQRWWIEHLALQPLRLYEVTAVQPGESFRLQDVVDAKRPSVLVRERAGTQAAMPFDLLAARIMPVEDHFELSGAMYSVPRHLGLELIEEIREELEDVEPGSSEAKEIMSLAVRDYWLRLFVSAFEPPTIVDHTSGEPMLFITDYYRVQDWDALERSLSGQADVEGNRQDGWNRLFEGEDGMIRIRFSLEPVQPMGRIKVSYHTQRHAEEGRPWLERTVGDTIVFLAREISDPIGQFAQGGLGEVREPPYRWNRRRPSLKPSSSKSGSYTRNGPTIPSPRWTTGRRVRRLRRRRGWRKSNSCCIPTNTAKPDWPRTSSARRCLMTFSGGSWESPIKTGFVS